MRTTLVGFSILAAVAVAAPALADDAPAPASDFTITGGAALTSDYRFRGVSQTNPLSAIAPASAMSRSASTSPAFPGTRAP